MKDWRVLIAVVLVIAVAATAYFVHRHREQERRVAYLYCSMDSSIPSIYSPEFENCVEQYLD